MKNINVTIEDELYEKISELKFRKKWTWRDYLREAYKELSDKYSEQE